MRVTSPEWGLYIRSAIFILFGTGSMAVAQGGYQLQGCDEKVTTGWAFYCDPPIEQEIEPAPPAPVALPENVEPQDADPKYPATEAMMAFRAQIEEARHLAVMNPTRENVLAYMELNKLVADKAGDFTETWQRILFNTPHLDANVKYPLAEAGVGVFQDQQRVTREATLRRIANEQGIMFRFDGSETCGICRVQGDILAAMEEHYGISILAVSANGGGHEAFPDAMIDDGRLQAMGLGEYPKPTLALVDPKTRDVSVIGSGLITAEDILERVHVIAEVPEGERY